MFVRLCFLAVCAIFPLIAATPYPFPVFPQVLYLTFTDDPAHTMTITWHALKGGAGKVKYKEASGGHWQEAIAQCVPLAGSEEVAYHAFLRDLEANTEYCFIMEGFKEEYKFKTLPKTLEDPIRFVVGGDLFTSFALMRKMNDEVASLEPDFIVVGGDIAYAGQKYVWIDEQKLEFERWRKFFIEWKKQMITSDKRVIPMIPVIGNHDISSGYKDPSKEPVLFFSLFPMRDNLYAYRSLDFGKYLTLVLLDTAHISPIAGEQEMWLQKTLKERHEQSWVIPVYHKSAYPAVYAYSSVTATAVRNHFVPHFEEAKIKVAFEHHNHCYKRTFPLKQGQINPKEGVVYLGDGCWGVSPREPGTGSAYWYLAKAAKLNHVFLVTLEEENMEVKAIDIKGGLIETMGFLKEPQEQPQSEKENWQAAQG